MYYYGVAIHVVNKLASVHRSACGGPTTGTAGRQAASGARGSLLAVAVQLPAASPSRRAAWFDLSRARAIPLRSVFEDLTMITTSADCRAGCAGGSGSCPDEWYPSSADTCNAACGRVYEPFCTPSPRRNANPLLCASRRPPHRADRPPLRAGDQCGTMLTDAAMGGMEEMGVFYDSCLQELYPPGSCGTFCNEHTFE